MIKVAYVGDSPFIHSGFGNVARAILDRLPKDEMELHGLGTMYQFSPKDISPFETYQAVCKHDLMGFNSSVEFIQHVDPDVLFMIADPGTLRNRFNVLMMSGRQMILPAVTYFPLEGYPFNPHIIEQARFPKEPVTYTKWGQQMLAEEGVDVDYVYHGADHGPFKPCENRDQLRDMVGWGDKFVVMLVGMNKRSNRQPAMIEAARILKDRGITDVVIYLHCQEQGEMFMAGWELGWMIDSYGVQGMVTLKPNQDEHKYIARPLAGSVEERGTPEETLATVNFVDLLGMADLYLDPASAHGFNLPAIEAAKCGVPVAMTDDGFARSEIYGDYAYMMKPSSKDYWHTGAWLPLVSPTTIADTIIEMKENHKLRSKVASGCKELADSLSWDTAGELFAEKIRSAHEFGKMISGS